MTRLDLLEVFFIIITILSVEIEKLKIIICQHNIMELLSVFNQLVRIIKIN